jgi:hypothetical protein
VFLEPLIACFCSVALALLSDDHPAVIIALERDALHCEVCNTSVVSTDLFNTLRQMSLPPYDKTKYDDDNDDDDDDDDNDDDDDDDKEGLGDHLVMILDVSLTCRMSKELRDFWCVEDNGNSNATSVSFTDSYCYVDHVRRVLFGVKFDSMSKVWSPSMYTSLVESMMPNFPGAWKSLQ